MAALRAEPRSIVDSHQARDCDRLAPPVPPPLLATEVPGGPSHLYFNLDTDIGDLRFKYNGTFYDTYDQEPGGDALTLLEAQEDGTLPASIPVTGFEDLIGRDGNQSQKHAASLRWSRDRFAIGVAAYRLGGFYQSSLTLDDGTRYEIPAFTTVDAILDYRFDALGSRPRIRFGVKNLTDEQAPLADRYFGFFADGHRDLGRYFYVDLRLSFE